MVNPTMICGVDEAGRGSLAGNVFAAAVILNKNKPIEGLTDSKKLTAKKREQLYRIIINNALSYSVSFASVEEIDRFNILQATLIAMKRAIEALLIKPNLVLIDGNVLPKADVTMKAIVRGDLLIKEISAASILAKVSRDMEMAELGKKYPLYGFSDHKGYGTKRHLDAINKYGVLSIHRKTFAPVKLIR